MVEWKQIKKKTNKQSLIIAGVVEICSPNVSNVCGTNFPDERFLQHKKLNGTGDARFDRYYFAKRKSRTRIAKTHWVSRSLFLIVQPEFLSRYIRRNSCNWYTHPKCAAFDCYFCVWKQLFDHSLLLLQLIAWNFTVGENAWELNGESNW